MHSMYIIILQYYKHHLRKTTIQRSQTDNERGKWGKVKNKKSSSFALLTHSHGAFPFPFFFFFASGSHFPFLPSLTVSTLQLHILSYLQLFPSTSHFSELFPSSSALTGYMTVFSFPRICLAASSTFTGLKALLTI